MQKRTKYRVIFTALDKGTNVLASSKIKAKLAAIHKLGFNPLGFYDTEVIEIK